MSIAFVEYKTLCITDVDAMDRSYCSSLVVAVKFFDMASDIKAPVDDPRIPKVDPRKFRWQMWMYITIAVIGLLLFFLS